MPRRVLFLSVVMLGLGTLVCAHAQPSVPSQPIHVSHNGDDRLGNHLLFQLRSTLRQSEAFTLSSSKAGTVQVALATQAISDTLTVQAKDGTVDVSVYTVTWLFNTESGATLFLKSTVGHFKRPQAGGLAESIAGETASLLSSLRAQARSGGDS